MLSGAAAALLAACGAPTAPPTAPAETTSASAQPQPGGTLRFGLANDLTTLEPHLNATAPSTTYWGVYDRLTAYDQNLQPQPELAESWDVSSDFKTITLKLRQGVTFHTGREFSSDDVKYNLLRVRDPKVGAAEFVNQSNWFTIDTPDKYTVVLRSDQPRPLVFDFFEKFNIADRETLEGPDARTKAVGTGPFTFIEWVQGDHFSLGKNKNYWKSGRPYLDGMVVSILRDATAMTVQFESGQLDLIYAPSLQDFVRLKADPHYQGITHPGNDSGHLLGANVLQPPMDNKLVRQAINYAMDRQRFVDTVLKGIGAPEFLFWNPKQLAYDPGKQNAYPFDLNKASSLLGQAGTSNLEFDYLVGPSGPGYDFAQIFQSDLASIGVKLNIKTLQGAEFLNQINNRLYAGVYYATASAQSEPASSLTYSKAWDPNNNNQGFRDDTYSQLIAAASIEPDRDKRKAMYAQLNDIFVDQAFVMALAVQTICMVTTSRVQGIAPLWHDAFSFKDAWFSA